MAFDDENEIIDDEVITKLPKILNIGVGQGGSRMALSLGMAFNSIQDGVYINTSMRDIQGLNSLNKKRFIKIGQTIEGTGKDRAVAERLLKSSYNEIVGEITKYANEKDYDFIFVSFSTAGGTGSGIGPKLTALLNSNQFINTLDDEIYNGKIPLVFGIAATPEISTNEGNISYENTLECLSDIDKYVKKDISRYFIINNGAIPGKTKEERTTQLEAVNLMVSTTIKRYLTSFGVSKVSNLDKADRYSALECMGIHSIITLDMNGTVTTSPFFSPNGERVRRICYEVPITLEKEVLKVLSVSGIFGDDVIHGLYDTENSKNAGLIPIIAYHGFKNTAKIAEMFNNRLKLNEENGKRIEEENIFSSTGLDSVDEERKKRTREYGRNSADTFESIF